MKRKELLVTGLFCVVVLATLLIFFLWDRKFEKSNVDYTAFLFLLLSEAALYTSSLFILSKKQSGRRLYLSMGVLLTLAVYWAVVVAYALFAAPLYDGRLKQFFLLEMMTLFMAAALAAIFTAASARFAENEAVSTAGERIEALAKYVGMLLADERFAAFYNMLSHLQEELSFVDLRRSTPEDEQLVSALGALKDASTQEETSEDFSQSVGRALTIAKQRNLATKRHGASF